VTLSGHRCERQPVLADLDRTMGPHPADRGVLPGSEAFGIV